MRVHPDLAESHRINLFQIDVHLPEASEISAFLSLLVDVGKVSVQPAACEKIVNKELIFSK